MAYPDTLGFRLGTTRPVRWIDPISLELTPLTLHPLTVMDRTIEGKDYMAIPSLEEAFEQVKKMIDITEMYSGDICLLWHNNTLSRERVGYQRQLYQLTLDYLCQV